MRTNMHTLLLALGAGAALGLLPVDSASAAPPILGGAWRAFTAGDFPQFGARFGAAGDLDGDGDVDLVLSRHYYGSPGLTVLLNRGDGSFAPPHVQMMVINDVLGEVALDDFDGDGDLDAIVAVTGAFETATRVAIFENPGSGLFGPRVERTVQAGPYGVALADVNGDGRNDVITANLKGDSVSVLLHNGFDGGEAGFLPSTSFPCGDNAARVAAGDLDGDGDVDLAVGRGAFVGGNGVTIMTNDGAGAFAVGTDFTSVPGAYAQGTAVALADVDLDGDLDLLSCGAYNATFGRSAIALRRNDGAGGFATPTIVQSMDGPYTPMDLRVVDLDGDGFPEILCSTPSGRTWDGFCVFGNDAGTPGAASFVKSAKQTSGLAIADFDADGDLDVAGVAEDSNVAAVHANDGAGAFPAPGVVSLNSGFEKGVDRGDIDGDGDLDMIAWDTWVRVLRNDGTGQLVLSMPFIGPPGLTDVRLRTMDDDALPDLLMLTGSTVSIARSFGNGAFQIVHEFSHGACAPVTVEAIDFDGDGDLDLAIPDRVQCVPGPRRINIYRNDGGGVAWTIMPPIEISSDIASGIIGGDFDHDGNMDILTQLSGPGIAVFLGLGNLTFLDGFPTGVYAYDYAAGDVNGDTHLDVVLLRPQPSFGTTTVTHLLGYGDGFFEYPVDIPATSGLEGAFLIASDVGCADVDADGRDDLVVTSNAACDVTVFRGSAALGLDPEQHRFGVAYAPRFSALGDFDGDGRTDVASLVALPPSGFSEGVMVLRSLAPPEPTPADGDIDGDGAVSFTDLMLLLGAWGPSVGCAPAHPADLDADCDVDFDDLLLLFAAWS